MSSRGNTAAVEPTEPSEDTLEKTLEDMIFYEGGDDNARFLRDVATPVWFKRRCQR
jgi:hypothetical protein